MGVRGPKKKLAEIDRLDGNPSRRKPQESGLSAGGAPFIPDHLDESARACFEIILRSMPNGVYARADSFEVAAFSVAWSEHKKAVEALATEPRLVEGSTGQLVLNPWIKHMNEQARVMMSLGDRLGLDPKSRAALHVPDEKPKSKFDGLINYGSQQKAGMLS